MAVAERKRTGRRVSPRKEIQETLRLRRGFERNLESSLGRFQKSLQREAAKEFTERGSFESDNLSVTLNQIMVPHYRAVVLAFAQRAAEAYEARQMKRTFEDLVSIYLSQQGGQRIRRVWQRYKTIIAQEIATGQRDGLSIPNIAKKLRESNLIDSPLRAATIARTETHSASQWANHEQHKEMMPVNTLKQWVAVGDARTRSHHAAMNGKQVGIDEDFEVITGGIPIPMSYAGDPKGGAANVINCRCQVIYIEPEDEVDAEEVQASKEPWLYKDKIAPSYDPEEWGDVGVLSLDGATGDQQDWGFARGLSDLELETIVAYTGFGYNRLNRTMRDWFYNTRRVTDQQKAAIIGVNKTIANGLRKLDPYEGLSTRGISVPQDDLLDWISNNEIKAGSVYRTESVFSTAAGRKGFAGNIKFEITGKHGRYIDDISQHQGEQEVLFPAGHEFRIDDVQIEGSEGNERVTVFMTDISDGIKSENVNIVKQVDGNIGRPLARAMQSEAPLASVNTVLIKGL